MNRPRRRAGLRETGRERAFSPSPSRFSRKRGPKEENVASPPGVRGFRFFRARESNAYGAENGHDGDGPALFPHSGTEIPVGGIDKPLLSV